MSGIETSAPLVTKTESGLLKLTGAGEEAVDPLVTSLDSNVYAFTDLADPNQVAAAMARLSRNRNDLRTILANEFLGDSQGAKDEELIQRVLNEYGDDSVGQLAFSMMVFEEISNLATKQVEGGRFAGYLEQSTRYLRFDQKDYTDKDPEGHYHYYVPEELDANTKEAYEEKLDEIFDIYSELYVAILAHIKEKTGEPDDDDPEVAKLKKAAWRAACHAQACDSIRGLLPAATKSTVGMAASNQAFYNMILHLEAEPLPEMKNLGRAALDALRHTSAGVFFKRIDVPEQGGLISDNKALARIESRKYAAELIEQFGGLEHETGVSVRLTAVDGTEDEVVIKILADNSPYSQDSIAQLVGTLSDDQKAEVIAKYVGDRYNRRVKPGRAFEYIHYGFDVVTDFGGYRDIQRSRVVDGLVAQKLNPYLGHGRPKVIDEAGLTDTYERAFEASRELYEELKERGYEEQAQYAIVFGYNMRYSFKVNARSFTHSAELRTTPQGHPSYREAYQEMARLVGETHPNIHAAMKFISQAEDAELAREGAELAKRKKLAALGIESSETDQD